jgi:hypothetical protein
MSPERTSEDLDLHVGRLVYEQFIATARAPTMARVARALKRSRDEVRQACHRLAEERAIVLQDTTGEILMAPPFSAVPTTFAVVRGRKTWWANCIWDALGIPVVMKADARIITSCPCCGDHLELAVENGALGKRQGLPHFALPLKQWWKDIFFA